MQNSNIVLSVKNLKKIFNSKTIIEDISLELHENEILGLVGPNGSGKTTILHILLGILKPTEGQIFYFSYNFKKYYSQILQNITFASNYIGLPKELTVEQNLKIYAQIYGLADEEAENRITKSLLFFNMAKYKNQNLASLSSGSIAKIMLIKAFLTNPKIVLLDEPTASLDIESAKLVIDFIKFQQKKYNISLIITSHNLLEIQQLCDVIITIDNGKITARERLILKKGLYNPQIKLENFLVLSETRITAVIKRYLLSNYKNANKLLTVIYWSFLNIVIWGTTSIWLSKEAEIPQLIAMILTGLIFWQIVFRVNIETAKSLYSEIVNKNLINLFASPLKLAEWIIAIMAISFIDMFTIIACGMICVKLLYNLNMFSLGFTIIPAMILLLTFGWSIGFFLCGLLLYFGQKAQDLIYSIGYLFVPFSAVYYPLVALPKWIQKIAILLPTTYVFESLRIKLTTGQASYTLLFESFTFSMLYLIMALAFLKLMFEKSRAKGLTKIN